MAGAKTFRGAAKALTAGVVLAGFATLWGCDLLRKAAIETVDPEIRKTARNEREPIRGGFRLGAYEFVRETLREQVATTEPGVMVDGRPRAGNRYELGVTMTVNDTDRQWRVTCVATRFPTREADFGAVAGEPNEAVDVACDLLSERASKWTFNASGRLDRNIAGQVHRVTDQGDASPLAVEIVLWTMRVRGLIRRPMPEPVAQVRHGKAAVAAMILSRPELAWVQSREPVELQDVAMATLGALAMIPGGFE